MFASNPAFNFEQLLQDAVARETAGECDDENSSSDDGESGSESDAVLAAPTSTHTPPTPTPTPNLSAKDRRRTRKKSQSHSYRDSKRQKLRDGSFSHHEHSMRVHRKYIVPSEPLVTPMSSKSGAARSTYIGLRDRKPTQDTHWLEDLVGPQSQLAFRLVEWDGRSNTHLIH